MNELSNKEDNSEANNTAGAENLQEKQSVQPELTNQQLANKIYPTAKTDSISRVYKNASNANENEDNTDREIITKGVKKALGIVSKVLVAIFAFFVISPFVLFFIAVILFYVFPQPPGSKNI